MAFEVSRTGYKQIDPTFGPGYPYQPKYHNVGQLQTPYQGKKFGQGGDYAPPQRTRYYNDRNPNTPYVLDKDFHAEEYLPTEGCLFDRPGYFQSYQPEYPDHFQPSNYFSPQQRVQTGHAKPSQYTGTKLYDGKVVPISSVRENYGSGKMTDYKKLRTTPRRILNSNSFYRPN